MAVGELISPVRVSHFALLLALLLAVAGRVQAERLPIKTYTTADGLARDQANRIVRDSNGFLWFCTGEGLSRFDGYKFTNYGTDQGLPHRQVSDFLETRSGVYWVATYGALCRFNPQASPTSSRAGGPGHQPRFLVCRLGDDAGSQIVNSLCEDRAGTVWCGTNSGLYRLDQINGGWAVSFVELHQPGGGVNPAVASIIGDRLGSLWISTWAELYRRRPDGIIERYAAEEGLPTRNFTHALLEDREGRIWVGTSIGLYQLVSEPAPHRPLVARVYTTKDGLATNSISCLFQSSDGRLWVGNWSALSECLPAANQGGQQFRKYTSANGVSDVLSLGEDRDGNLWIGTGTRGVMKIVRNGFLTYDQSDGLGGTRIAQISEDRAGELCVISGAPSTGFVNRLDDKTFTAIQLTLPKGITKPSWGWYQTMLQDAHGEWWVATAEGLVRYPKLTRLDQLTRARPKAIYTTRDGLSGNEIFRVFEDSRGDLWIGTITVSPNTLTRWERSTETFHQYSTADGIPARSAPTAFCEDAAGNLWIGFYNGGVARYREGRFAFLTAADGVPEGVVRALYLDHAGRLWIATSEGGVSRADDPGAGRPQFVTYSTADGLSSNQATCITEDREGRVYIGTGRGVDQLDPTTGQVKHYTTADGLANSYVNVSFRDRGGALWFGTLDGLSRFTPQPDDPEPPPILIGGLRIAGVPQAISELGETMMSGLTLEPNQNQLQIEFFGLGFAPGEMLRYQYRLEGADRDWSPLTDQLSINYANLSPGTYRFVVRAITAAGLMSPSPATIAFTIRPPIWRRWWFVALVTIAVGAMGYSLYRYRVARLIELERVRTRIATDLHDDIGSSLSQVSVLSEVIRRRLGGDQQVLEPLSMIANLSRDLVDSMNDIVWAINPRRDHLSDLTQRMRRFASDVFTAREIEFSFSVSETRQDLRLGADLRREVFLIFKESVNNMVRHSGCTEAEIELVLREGWLELKVRDNGRGFDPERVNEGNGLESMRQRAMKLGGALDISSNNGQGTIVKLRASLGRRGWFTLKSA